MNVNFSNTALRKGRTIQPFTFPEIWQLFVRSVGWETKLANHEIPQDEYEAAQALVRELEGLPLSLAQTASLSKTPRFPTMQDLLRAFRQAKTTVPPRPTHVHSTTNHTIDAIWYVSFQNLGTEAKGLLSILCLLSPDITFLDVFQPRDQAVLTPFTEFCRRESTSSTQMGPGLRKAVAELLEASLIKREGRILTIHRVVQEAFFYVNKDEYATSFNSAVRLINEAFPKQVNGRPLHKSWEKCERFIHEAISLCIKYRDFQKSGKKIEYPPEFCSLLMNCAWFLLEVGDYGEIFRLLDVAYAVCDDKESLNYAHLRNTAGSCYFELNNLGECRTAYEEALRIRSRLLDPDNEELMNTINNMGNLEQAEGNYEKALELFSRAREARMNAGEETRLALSLTLMGIGRTYESMKQFAEAQREYEEAEGVIFDTSGSGSPFMAKYVLHPNPLPSHIFVVPAADLPGPSVSTTPKATSSAPSKISPPRAAATRRPSRSSTARRRRTCSCRARTSRSRASSLPWATPLSPSGTSRRRKRSASCAGAASTTATSRASCGSGPRSWRPTPGSGPSARTRARSRCCASRPSRCASGSSRAAGWPRWRRRRTRARTTTWCVGISGEKGSDTRRARSRDAGSAAVVRARIDATVLASNITSGLQT